MDYICPIVMFLFWMALVVAIIASMWKVFEKAGQPGWAAIVPVYNMYILTIEIAKKEILWFILLFVPFVNLVAGVLISIEVAKKFGKSEVFGIGLAFLGFVFYPILAFGDAKYGGGRSRRRDDDDDDDYDDEPRPRTRRRDDDD